MKHKPTTDFAAAGQVYIDPAAAPAAHAYAASMGNRAAARAGLPKYSAPVGGGPGPAIPHLDAEHTEHMTMAQQAELINGPSMQEVLQQGTSGNSIVETPVMPGFGGKPAPLNLKQTDTLPQQVVNDPSYRGGPGSMLAVNQPHLAERYGVMRGGQHVPPQQLRQASQPGQRAGLRPETLEGLKKLQEAQTKDPNEATETEKAEREYLQKTVEHSAAGASSKVNNPFQGEGSDSIDDEEVKRRMESMDAFDFEAFRNAMRRDVINNPEQKKIIEERLRPLDFEQLLMKNRVTQDVPIIPGKFMVTYTSMTMEDDLALKRIIMFESRSVEVTQRYLLDKYAVMAVTCGVTRINNHPIITHLKDDRFDEDLFSKKLDWMMQRPLHMLASMGVNHTWFESRVRELFEAKRVGNT